MENLIKFCVLSVKRNNNMDQEFHTKLKQMHHISKIIPSKRTEIASLNYHYNSLQKDVLSLLKEGDTIDLNNSTVAQRKYGKIKFYSK
jgi:hypothetical protein